MSTETLDGARAAHQARATTGACHPEPDASSPSSQP